MSKHNLISKLGIGVIAGGIIVSVIVAVILFTLGVAHVVLAPFTDWGNTVTGMAYMVCASPVWYVALCVSVCVGWVIYRLSGVEY